MSSTPTPTPQTPRRPGRRPFSSAAPHSAGTPRKRKHTRSTRLQGIKEWKYSVEATRAMVIDKLKLYYVPDDWQIYLIIRILRGYDSIFLAGTSYGKSLVFEAVAVLGGKNKVTIIAYPFNSTMSGQLSTAVTPSPLPRGNHLASTSALGGMPSSDPPEMGALNPYPEIADFFRKVDVHYPRRCLLNLISNFDDQNYFNIEEIATLGSADAISRAVSITTGNAAFILGEVLSEIKRIDKAKARLRA
ncbi:hypothetical protein B0H10DRAFT_2234863 [Mycena sp. CBHHK59/15]|nr:hypothetical protein B0H10DRAFT_2234863 [Mycena sp. CBHHK59/15]